MAFELKMIGAVPYYKDTVTGDLLTFEQIKRLRGSKGASVPAAMDEGTTTPAPESAIPASGFAVSEGSDVPTYSEYLTMIGSERDAAYEAAEDAKVKATNDAAVVRERAITDANTSHQLNTARYGSKEERLASSGLGGSGYADYLTSRSYATQRSEIQNALAREESANRSATETERLAKASADSTYYQKAQTEKKRLNEVYNSIFADSKTGDFTSDEIRALALRNGFDETDADTLAKIANDAYLEKEQNKHNDKYNAIAELASSGDYSSTQIYDRAIAEGMNTDEAKELAWNAEEPVYNTYINILGEQSGAFDIKGLLDDYKAGVISKDVYEKVRENYGALVKSKGASFFDGASTTAERWERYAHAIWYGNLDDATKQALTNAYQALEPANYRVQMANPNSGIYRAPKNTNSNEKYPSTTWNGGSSNEQSYTSNLIR